MASFLVHPQPYPAVRMPRFAVAPNAHGLLAASSLEITVGFASGPDRRVAPADLSGDVRSTQVQAMLAHAFRGKQQADLDAELLGWLDRRVAEVDPRHATEVTFCWRSARVDVARAAVASSGPCDLTRIRLGR